MKSELESTTPLERKLSDSSQSSSSAETINGKVKKKLFSISRLAIVSLNKYISGKNWRSTGITMSSANCQETDCQSNQSQTS